MKFHVRDIGSDTEWLQACELLRQVYVGDGYTTAASAAEFMVRDRFENHSHAIVALDDAAHVQGVVLFLLKDSPLRQVAQADEREFRLLGVAALARGSGAGQALVQACVDRAQAADASALVLWTQPRMLAAHRLYERMGFNRAPDRDTLDERGFMRLVYVRRCALPSP